MIATPIQSNQAFSAAGGSSRFETLSFSNGGGVSFTNSNGQVAASVQTNYLTTAAQSNQVVNSLNGSTGQISLNVGSSLSASTNGSSITFGLASNITTALQSAGAYLTTAAQSNQVVNSINGSTGVFTFNTGSSLSSSRNGNSFTWGLASDITTALQSAGAYLTTAALSNHSHGVSFTSGSTVFQTLSFTNSNGISFNSGTQGIFGSHNAITTGRASTDAIGLNTAQTNVTWTVNSSGLSLNAAGYAGTGLSLTNATATLNSLGLQLSVGGGGVTNQTGPNIAAGTQTGTSGTIVFSNSNNISFGMSNSSIVTASFDPINIGMSTGGNTAGTTNTFDGAGLQYIFAGGTNITLSQSSNASSVTLSVNGLSFSNSNNITFGINAGTLTASYLEPFQSYFQYVNAYQGTTAFTLGGSSIYVQPFVLPFNISASYIRIANSIAFGSTTGGTTANTSLTLNNSQTVWVNIYTKGGGASSKSLQYITGGSVSFVFQVRAEIGAASNNQTISHNFTYPLSEGGAQGNYATNYNVNSGSYNISTTHLTSFNGFRWLDVPFAASLTAGDYWMGVAQSTATATTGAIGAMTNVTVRNTYVAVSQINTNVALMGVSSNMSTAPWLNGLGLWSTNSIGTSTSSMGLASISSSANQPVLPFQIIREA